MAELDELRETHPAFGNLVRLGGQERDPHRPVYRYDEMRLVRALW